jgi:acetyl-CoA carboxylase carboxyl transferase subunit alpha
MPETLDFEEPIAPLLKQLEELTALPQTDSVQREIETLRRKIEGVRADVYALLTPWQRVQVARHPNRPGLESFIDLMFENFVEIHGDRRFADDPAIMTGFAEYKRQPVLVVGHVKGTDTKDKIFRNFGYARPEGYRKALRAMRLAEKFRRPIVVFIDTPAAYPGMESEERGVAEAIAVNLREMARLEVPIVTVVIGEGGSGGALAIAVSDVVLMFENSVYSVISPEGCASILWRDGKRAPQAAEALKLTAPDLERLNIIDGILPEPIGGAHRDHDGAAATLGAAVRRELANLSSRSGQELKDRRLARFRRMGVFRESDS